MVRDGAKKARPAEPVARSVFLKSSRGWRQVPERQASSQVLEDAGRGHAVLGACGANWAQTECSMCFCPYPVATGGKVGSLRPGFPRRTVRRHDKGRKRSAGAGWHAAVAFGRLGGSWKAIRVTPAAPMGAPSRAIGRDVIRQNERCSQIRQVDGGRCEENWARPMFPRGARVRHFELPIWKVVCGVL